VFKGHAAAELKKVGGGCRRTEKKEKIEVSWGANRGERKKDWVPGRKSVGNRAWEKTEMSRGLEGEKLPVREGLNGTNEC